MVFCERRKLLPLYGEWNHAATMLFYAISKLSCALYLLQVTLNITGLVQVTSLIKVHTRDLITIEEHTRDTASITIEVHTRYTALNTQKPNCEFADRLLHVEHEILHIAHICNE